MKFAYLCSDVEIPLLGDEGCSIHIREIVNALVELGHEVVVFCAWKGDSSGPVVSVPVYSFESDDGAELPLHCLRQDPVVRRYQLDRDLTALSFNWWMQGEGLSILERERPDVVYERFALFGWAGLTVSRKLDIPLMLEVNSPLREEQAGYDKFVLTRMAELIEGEVLRGADTVLPVSRWLKEWTQKQGVAPNRIHVMPNGVSERHFANQESGERIRQRLRLAGRRVIGYVGSFQQWHDVPGLLTAFQQLHRENSELRLLLVGDGEQREDIVSLVDASGLKNAVVMTGSVPFDEVPLYVAAMDIPVVPYSNIPDFYFSPIKLFESMASGRPTVAAALGQIAELVEHRRTGWLYKPGDVNALADGLRALLHTPDLAAAIGQAGREVIVNRYTWKGIATRIVELAEELGQKRQASMRVRAGFRGQAPALPQSVV